MKVAIISTVIGIVWLLGLNALAQGTCPNSGGGQPSFPQFSPSDPVFQQPLSSPFSGQVDAVLPASTTAATPAAPRARISVVGSGSESVASRVPTARLSVVTETLADTNLSETAEVEDKVADSAETPTSENKLPSALQGLAGTWLAVARHGDGELTTVELRLDDRGWAELTVPGKDGKPSTSKSRLGFEDDELKLIGPEAEQSLGKLLEQTDRQMVLAQAGGNVTFVRQ